MQRAIIYARVSTEDQVEKYGLPVQVRACQEHAETRGWDVVKVIQEDFTGTVLDRPGLSEVRQLIAGGGADVLVMLDVDRLSRQVAHLLILKPEIERHAQIEFVKAKFEDSPAGRLFFSMRGVIAQYERELTRERTMAGKRERARAGLIVGGRTAYGYRYQGGKLSPDDERADTVREIFRRYDVGESMRSIAFWLRSIGAPTWSGRKWGHSSVRRILVNESYCGRMYYGTHRREGKLLRLRPESERISFTVPALIERSLWERVQAKMADPVRHGRPSAFYMLRGLLHCSCGRRMSGELNRKYRSYRCNGRDALRFRGGACRCAVATAKLDAAVWDALLEAFTDPQFLRQVLRENQGQIRKDGSADTLAQLEERVCKLKLREDAALTAMLDPDLKDARSALKQRYREAHQERTRLEAQIAVAAGNVDTRSSRKWLDETAALLREYIPTVTDPAQRQAFVRGCVTEARWNGKEVEVDCFLEFKRLPELITTS